MISDVDRLLVQHLMGEDAFSQSKYVTDYYYISNTDGSIRWLFRKTQRIPTFLSFYSTSSIRAKILAWIIRLAFFIRLPTLVTAGTISLQVSEDSPLGRILNRHKNCNYSIFTGTVGENRKSIVEVSNQEGTLAFVKVGTSESSIELVEKEVERLSYLNSFVFETITVPKIVDSSETGIVELSNVKPKSARQYSRISELHIAALHELYDKSCLLMPWSEIMATHQCKESLEKLIDDNLTIDSLTRDRVDSLLKNVGALIESLDSETEITKVSLAHGDFTPWNMYLTKRSVCLFDWELNARDMPILYDAIHFSFQSGVMLRQAHYDSIYADLMRMAQLENFKSLVSYFTINVKKHYQFYLVYTVIYYIEKYAKQDKLHEQAVSLIAVWEDAVEESLRKEGIF